MRCECLEGLPEDFWLRDPAVQRARAVIEQARARIRAVSFDFFDTLVWRWTDQPSGVFVEVGERLRDRGALPSHWSSEDYHVYRRMAEVRTRQKTADGSSRWEDITLKEILEELRPLGVDASLAAEAELTAEEDLCCINPALVQFALWLRERGLRVVVISDVYLSAGHLARILQVNGCDPALFHRIYTSADHRVCKSTGNLFRAVLRAEGWSADQWLHLGDNLRSDVLGAWSAGVRAVPYTSVWPSASVILEREGFLPGRRVTVFSTRALRFLATRRFAGEEPSAFFGRAGALVAGPVLSGFAGWACEQFAAAGVRKVGAFMREGALLGQMLEREAHARGLTLEVRPLYVNRISTDLAALGRLTAHKLIEWIGRRQTLSAGDICKQLGLDDRDLSGLPLPAESRLDSEDRILELAKWLFRPEIAKRIETRSRQERRMFLEYLGPWLEAGGALGLCDIGYNATAQYQMHQILRLEGLSIRMVGCYVLGCEVAALRALEGLDVRTYLGSFGHPAMTFWAFLRSPAFLEQLINASCGTTTGYQRCADGTVVPVLSPVPLPEALRDRQRWFQEGVLWYQTLWLWARRLKPRLSQSDTSLGRRWTEDLKVCHAATLARAAAFPLPEEVQQFGGLILDDRYVDGGQKTLCATSDQDVLRQEGYIGLLRHQGVLWPQAVHHRENPRAADEWFAYGRAMLVGAFDGLTEGGQVRLTVVIPAMFGTGHLPACLTRLRQDLAETQDLEVLLLTNEVGPQPGSALRQALRGLRHRWLRIPPGQPGTDVLRQGFVEARGSLVLWLRPDVVLPPGGALQLRKAMETRGVGAVLPVWSEMTEPGGRQNCVRPALLSRCFMIRREAFEDAAHAIRSRDWADACVELLTELEHAGWLVQATSAVVATADVAVDESVSTAASPDVKGRADVPDGGSQLARWLGIEPSSGTEQSSASGEPVLSKTTESAHAEPKLVVDWVGSFLDHGSLSHVNREWTRALAQQPGIELRRISRESHEAPAFATWKRFLEPHPSRDAAVTVRHGWPPDWSRPERGRLVVIQPWEFGALPEDWVRAAAHVDEFWVPSCYVREVYVTSGVPVEKVMVLPNGVDPERFHPSAPARVLPTRKSFRFLFVGGTIARKGPDILLRAYLESFTAADDVCLVIKDCGGRTHYAGQTFADQIRAAQARPDTPEILYLDEEWPPEDLPGLYTACHCLVLPYRGEGFGLPVLEAMACGLPVIVTGGGATDDFVTDQCGWRIRAERRWIGDHVGPWRLVKTGWWLEPDARALASALRDAWLNPNECRRRGLHASAHARTYFSWAKTAEQAVSRLRALAGEAIQDSSRTASGPSRSGVSRRLTLPGCARLGALGRARELMGQRRWPAAWQAVLEAMRERPFHPEGWLLLAELARSVGAGKTARQCAQTARRLAPGYAPARQFLKRSFSGAARPDWMQLPSSLTESSQARPRLTVCLITRNEEAFLDACLRSIQGVADQIVVVDTGSTDRTVEIARAHGAEVHNFEWCDDFSAARNAALEHARGDWILMLDADEELTEEGRRELDAALRCPEVIAWRLPLVDVGREAEGVSYVPRLFRNAPGLFYVGRIHEQVFSSLEVRRREWGLECRPGRVLLRHHGYRPEVVRDRNKVERNLRLLRRAIEEMPGEPHLLMNLGLELARSGCLEEALVQYRAAFEALAKKPAEEVVPELRESLLTQFASRLFAARRWDEVIQVLTSPLAREHGGLTASLHFSLGLAYLERGQFSEAADQMRQCLAKRDRPTLASVLPEIRTAAPHHCLALALWRLGRGHEARQAFETALAGPGMLERIRLDYARFLVEQDQPVEALRTLTACVTEKPDLTEAWQLGGQIALSRPEFLEFACDWTAEAMRYQGHDPSIRRQRATALLLAGDSAGARPLWWELEERTPHAENISARLLCDLWEGRPPSPWSPTVSEPQVSQAWLSWYRRLHQVGAKGALLQLHESLPVWRSVLPTAAQCLEAAIAEAHRESVLAAG
ncbi:MAG: glycosyltransferase [Verrucomicrobiota bacterium]|nr:glycosyltransferase [Limisphaera sp.]MDW8381061.1 glycosyltransferase [Verrucomicrobiota bacterium]